MKPHLIEQAINEQARGYSPRNGLDTGVKGKRLTKHQICHHRRSTENILVDMADKLRDWQKSNRDEQKKDRKRLRRRGPRIQAVRFF
jgi:hypothetical protein